MKIYTGFLLLLASLPFCCFGEMIRLFNTGNALGFVTSSTLSWVLVRRGEKFPENAIPVSKGGPFWCRSFHHGIWVAGAVIEGTCHAPFFGNVNIADQYQALVSVNGSARLVNVPWDSLIAVPANSLTTPNMLLALSNDAEAGSVLPGYVDAKKRRAHFLRGNKALKLTGGFIVTEDEPIAYELTDFRLDDKTKKSFHDEVLMEFTLENSQNYPEKITKEITFVSPHTTYFGKVKGTIMGLPSFVNGPDTFPVNITWGINNQLDEIRNHAVQYSLPGKTRVSVQLIAAIRVIDGGYGGNLKSFYRGGEVITRHIGGLHMERRLGELRAEFSQVKSTIDDSPIEELPSQTMILLHSTTTTTPSPGNKLLLPRPELVGVNDATRAISCCILPFLFISYLLK